MIVLCVPAAKVYENEKKLTLWFRLLAFYGWHHQNLHADKVWSGVMNLGEKTTRYPAKHVK